MDPLAHTGMPHFGVGALVGLTNVMAAHEVCEPVGKGAVSM